MMMDDYDGQMIFGDLVGLKLPDIRPSSEEKPPKKPHPGNLSQPGIEPGPAAWQVRMLPLVPQRWTRTTQYFCSKAWIFFHFFVSSLHLHDAHLWTRCRWSSVFANCHCVPPSIFVRLIPFQVFLIMLYNEMNGSIQALLVQRKSTLHKVMWSWCSLWHMTFMG